MSAIFYPAGSADREDNEPLAEGLVIAEAEIAHSWGAQPASAVITYTAAVNNGEDIRALVTGVGVNTYLEIVLGPYRFYGICQADVALQGSGGRTRVLDFLDLRTYLDWDVVRGVFNRPLDRLVTVGSRLLRRRRWEHLLPGNVTAQLWTTTDAPLTATAILNYLLGAPTVGSVWAWHGPAFLDTLPVLDLDWERGVKLGQALLRVAEKAGVQFTLGGKYLLKFRRKGELLAGETFPVALNGDYVFPEGAENCRDGLGQSGQPTRVKVVGDRNLYQVHNLELVPEWNREWDEFWDEWLFIRRIFTDFTKAVGGDAHDIQRWANAQALAARITVREFAAEAGAEYGDDRLFAGRSRMDLPALLYIRHLVFRAWRLPDTILGRAASRWRILDTQLAAVEHDEDGVMAPRYDGGEPVQEEGNGYVIVEGVEASANIFGRVDPATLDLGEWVTANTAWGVQTFTVDPDRGDGIGFVLFDAPMLDPTDMLVRPAATPQAAVLNADFTPEPAAVRATLTLAGELYEYDRGSGSRDEIISEPGLRHEVLWNALGPAYIDAIPYADGEYPDEKAQAVADSVLGWQWIVRAGGYDRLVPDGAAALVLNGAYDRVNVKLSPRGGLREFIDFTTERQRAEFEPERDYDRRVGQRALFPGQEALRRDAANLTTVARTLGKNPRLRRSIADDYRGQLGTPGRTWGVRLDGATEATPALAAGTPLWWDRGDEAVAAVPSAAASSHRVFQGVTTRHAEPALGLLPVQAQGRVFARVLGPVANGDRVGFVAGQDYLAVGASPEVGEAQTAHGSGTVALIAVQVGGGAVGVPGDWD